MAGLRAEVAEVAKVGEVAEVVGDARPFLILLTVLVKL